MLLTLLQLNMNSDNFWDTFTPFLCQQNFDVIQLQEVTGKDTFSGNIHSTRDCFFELKQLLGEKYHGELVIAQRYSSNPLSYVGNATFYKKKYLLKTKHSMWMHQGQNPFPSDSKSYEDVGRALLHVTLTIEGKNISFLNTHFAWANTSKEQPHQTKQGEILLRYLKAVTPPFIFSGDLNLDPEQPLIQKINKLARNLTSENKIRTTLNPRVHRAQELFPPGVCVDYIFTSRNVDVKNTRVLSEEDFSDHLGLTTEIEI